MAFFSLLPLGTNYYSVLVLINSGAGFAWQWQHSVFFKLSSWTYDYWPLYEAAAVKSVLTPRTIIKSNSNYILAIIWLHFLLHQGSNPNDLLINVKEIKFLCLLWGIFFSYMKFYKLSPDTLFSECMIFIFFPFHLHNAARNILKS